jgi:hypothetical protein
MHVQGFRNVECEDAVLISKSINDRGDYILEIKLANEVVETIKEAKSDKKNSKISVDDSIFQTMLGNLISYYLLSKTNLIKLAQTVSIVHQIVSDVCSHKLNEAVDIWSSNQAEEKEDVS